MRALTEQEMGVLTNALTVAAQRFRDNAAVLQPVAGLPVQPGIADLIRVFLQQEKDTLALFALLAGATIEVTPAEYSPCGWGDCGPGCECGGSAE